MATQTLCGSCAGKEIDIENYEIPEDCHLASAGLIIVFLPQLAALAEIISRVKRRQSLRLRVERRWRFVGGGGGGGEACTTIF